MKLLFWLIVAAIIAAIFILFSRANKEQKVPETKEATPSAVTKGKPRFAKFPGVLPESELKNRRVSIKTAKGDIIIELLGSEAPKATSNFIFLSKEGFYDGLTFHRREERFVIQGGDPNGDGTGGPGYQFEDEPVTKEYERGTLAMANSGPNTNGSQFFIMLSPVPLPKNYTIFGKVIEGMDIVDKIRVGDLIQKVTIE